MNYHRHLNPGARRHAPTARVQRGVTLLYGLLALLIMMVGAAAMVRSMNTSMVISGNLAFKRDLTNQAERAAAQVMPQLQTGGLAAEATRQTNQVNLNYSATILPTNAQGMPNALVDNAAFAARGSTANDITVADQAVTVRYLIDRLCANAGVADDSHCTMSDPGNARGGSSSQLLTAEDSSSGGKGALQALAVYRLSIRVSGPRNTQAFFQSTFSL
jgi:type IV pilus assembly protein PilX